MVEAAQKARKSAKVGMNQYLLKGEKRNESWQVRTNKVFATINNKRRQLQYSEGELSIFKDEQNKESKPTYIWFERGSLLIHPNDKTKNSYVQNHPDFNRKFYLYDQEDESMKELAVLEEENTVRSMLNKLDVQKQEAVATSLFGMSVVSTWKPTKVRLELFRFLKNSPDKLKKAINDPATDLMYLTSGAIKLGIISISPDKNSINWADSGLEIIPIPRGMNPLKEMSIFLRTNEALTTLQSIGEQMDSKIKTQGKKGTKK
jgi:hypothetical protein